MKARQEIKEWARDSVKEQRSTAILLGFLYLLTALASGILDFAVEQISGRQGIAYWVVYTIGMFILYVMLVNMIGEYIKIYKGERANAAALFSGLGVNFLRKLGGMLWMYLWIILWALLLIIPGIIKSVAYIFTPYILADCPDVPARDALKISMRITDGYKMDIFVFGLTWVGWIILSALTLGILYIVFVGPYMYTAYSGLYVEMRKNALEEGRVTPEELGLDREPWMGAEA